MTTDTDRQILRARARLLARPPEQPMPGASFLELLEFGLGRERYAVESSHVKEVCPFKDLTPLPCAPSFVLGIVNVRGHILPVFDLQRLFGLPEKGLTDLHRIILVRNDNLELGLLADTVIGTRSIASSALQPSLAGLDGVRGDYLKGVTADRLVVLDLPRILSDPRIVVNEEVEA